MNKRTESIRLKHLQDIYYEKLQEIAYSVYDEQLHNRIIRPEELDADIHRYFRHTQPSLQDFYSRYASQWEYFHEISSGRPQRKILSQTMEHAKAKQTKIYAISLGGKSAETSYLKLCDKHWEYSIQNAESLNKNRIEESNI